MSKVLNDDTTRLFKLFGYNTVVVRELKNKIKNTGELSPVLKELVEWDNSAYEPIRKSFQQFSEQLNEALKPARESASKLVGYIEDSYKPILIQASQISELLNSFTWPNNINPTKEEAEKSIDSIVNEIEKKPVSPEKTELVNVLKGIKLDEIGTTKEKVSLERAREILKTNNPNIADEVVLESLAFWERLVEIMMPRVINMRKVS